LTDFSGLNDPEALKQFMLFNDMFFHPPAIAHLRAWDIFVGYNETVTMGLAVK
jgi:hypothetical protein